jgi:hypothetical protein
MKVTIFTGFINAKKANNQKKNFSIVFAKQTTQTFEHFCIHAINSQFLPKPFFVSNN